MNSLLTFILFLVLSGLCFIIYYYLSSKISLLRKQIMLLRNQNEELKRKLNKLMKEQELEKCKPAQTILLLENHEADYEIEENPM